MIEFQINCYIPGCFNTLVSLINVSVHKGLDNKDEVKGGIHIGLLQI